MKLLLLNYEFPPLGGGASPVSYEIAKRLSEKGITIDVVTMGYKDLPQKERINKNLTVYRVPCLRSKKEVCYPYEQLTYLLSGFFKSIYLFKKNQYDICHTHFIIPTGVLALFLKKLFGLDYVITSHGSDVPKYNPDRFTLLHKFTTPFLKIISSNAEGITTPSKYLKKLIHNQIGNYSIKVIPNGCRDYYDKNIEKENIICSSGRLLERKGFHFLIRSFKRIKKRGWKLIIMGDGPYKNRLKELANGSRDIIFTGWLDNEGKKYRDVLNKSKIFCLLSSRESQGIVFLEAMSAKCAIVGSDVTACIETVSDKVGFSVERNNLNEISQKIGELINDEEKLKIFMENSRKRFCKYYYWPKILKKYINLFNNII